MATNAPTSLVIDDEVQIRRFLRATLSHNGYKVVEAGTGTEGLARAAAQEPDIVLLDLGLPDIDGLEVIGRLREWTVMPIIVLSVRERESDKVTALNAGADDYITKPFGVRELLARMQVALRHSLRGMQEPGESLFTVDSLQVDLVCRKVFVADTEVHLTPIEYKLLATLIQHVGKVLTHRQLLHDVWGPEYVSDSHSLRVHMAQLRRKLETDPAHPRYLLTEVGVGYRLAAD